MSINKFVIMLAAIAAGILLLLFALRGQSVMLDRLNPIIPVKPYYTIVQTDGKKLNDKQWEYQLVGYDEEGQQNTFIMIASKNLRKGAYLEVYAKGLNGKGWTEVTPAGIPEKAQIKLSSPEES
ncbi:YxeA family protein [Brevibacillus laterosporus]|uniref:YxeA family protein n=1 Tax=Brevibacillus laterosporus TaxID=1465 RepID=UPI00264EEBE4|nr:YxeA family protein [Brevibacillus laterosporus]MDN9010137.1 YxeA family protein [Brevibacillus laterosporus]MDO0941391.1 YxeA family protein [Brevibacillus laterosporus]